MPAELRASCSRAVERKLEHRKWQRMPAAAEAPCLLHLRLIPCFMRGCSARRRLSELVTQLHQQHSEHVAAARKRVEAPEAVAFDGKQRVRPRRYEQRARARAGSKLQPETAHHHFHPALPPRCFVERPRLLCVIKRLVVPVPAAQINDGIERTMKRRRCSAGAVRT
jgi:hypothetical protein